MRDGITVNGTRRTYEIIGPSEGEPGRSLVLVFHGSRQSGAKHREFTGRAYDALAEGGAAVVVYADGYKGNWNDARRESAFPARADNIDDVGFTRALVEKLAGSHGIDPAKVYAIGYSNGGQMVMRLAHEAPALIAGATVIAATMPAPESFLLAGAPSAPMPVLLINGTKDPIVKYEGGQFSWWARKLFKVGGRSLSAPETAAYFAGRNGITAPPTTTNLPAADAATSVERTEYREPGRPTVALYTVHGGGHTIPGPAKAPAVMGRTNQDVHTAQMVDDFFTISEPARQ
ncbi:alpha/beta hydrolase family esterase [Paractinoplanes atraurantiacus]|uniref:Polyhydroxybutyrate depolymerase n=1 Tax=Paractinoplanes atraurantiacus TaxID=1036182 RepID=A0A285JFJ6_9ACTN|nr:PHB depolymerase family esterase [Actinoplanes atraurantiacus]SNY59048.1 polyhydroxybutyrate depolymerase [Actinoplanes atraurantiacus]